MNTALAQADRDEHPQQHNASASAAVLRWRSRWLREQVNHRTAEALKLLPVLLHGSFQLPALKGEAPGIHGMRFRPGWGPLARSFNLPPPFRLQRGRALIEALIAVPRADGEVLVLAVFAGGDAADDERVRERLAAAQKILAQSGANLAVEVIGRAPRVHSAIVHRALAFGATLVGKVPATLVTPLPECSLDDDGMRDLFTAAPTPLVAASLLAAARSSPSCPAVALARAGTDLPPARALSDPDLFCALWLGVDETLASLLRAAVALASDRPLTRRALGAAHPLSTGAALATARALSARCALGARRLRRSLADPLWAQACRTALGPGVPRALLPAVAELFPEGRLAETLCRQTVDQRAMETVESRMSAPVDRQTLVLLLDPAEVPGPPFDPLNRGASRSLGLGTGVALRLAPGRRPTARPLSARACVERALRDAAAGRATEILPRLPEALVAASRLRRAANLAQTHAANGTSVAIEAGGRVLLVGSGSVRSFPLESFARRPRRCAVDPEAPDLSLSPDQLGKPRSSLGAAVLECRAEQLTAETASVLTADSTDGMLREVVRLDGLEEYLQEAQVILRTGAAGRILAVRCGASLEAAMRRFSARGQRVDVHVRGTLPFGLEVVIDGQSFGGPGPLGWATAASAVLAGWPPGHHGRIAVKSVAVKVNGKPASGLLLLYARSLALRRLRAQIDLSLRQAY